MITSTGSKGLDLLSLAILTLSLIMSIAATVSPHWLEQEQVAFLPKTSYGLWKLCVTPPFGDHQDPSCSPFPGKDLCGSKNSEDAQSFCNAWKLSRYSMLAACIAGGVAILSILAGVFMSQGQGLDHDQHTGLIHDADINPTLSSTVNLGLGLHTLLQLLTMAIMVRMLTSANKQLPIYQTAYGYSFGLATASWVINIFLSGVVFAGTYVASRGGVRGLSGGYQEIGRPPM